MSFVFINYKVYCHMHNMQYIIMYYLRIIFRHIIYPFLSMLNYRCIIISLSRERQSGVMMRDIALCAVRNHMAEERKRDDSGKQKSE